MSDYTRILAKNTPYSTYQFSKSFANKIKANQTTNTSSASKTLGLHAENVIVDALDRLSESKGQRTPPPNPAATQALYNAGDLGDKARRVVDAAAQQAALQIKALLDKELKNTEKKEYKITTQGMSGNSPIGDLKVIVNGKSIVFEMKYQSNPGHMTRWFGLSSNTLFGDDSFKYYLSNRNLYLHRLPESVWRQEVQSHFAEFINEAIGISPSAQVSFFLEKGKAIPNDSFDAKYVVHMMGQKTKIDVTLTSIEELQERLSQVSSRHQSMLYSLAARDKVDSVAYETAAGATLAQAGISAKTTKDFTIDFYIAQKLVNAAAIK